MYGVLVRFGFLVALALLSVGLGCGGGSPTKPTEPGDLLVVEPSTGNILGVSPNGVVFTTLSSGEIQSVTGFATVNLDRKGIAIDPRDGTAYFSEQESGALLKFPVGGPVSILAPRSAFDAAAGATDHFNLGIALSSDGLLYLTSNHSGPSVEDGGTGIDRVFRVDPATGAVLFFAEKRGVEQSLSEVSSYDTEQAIVAGDSGAFYVANTNSGAPPGVIAFASNGTPSVLNVGMDFSTGNALRSMTRDPTGDIIVRDDEANKFTKVASSDGAATDFLTQAQLDTAVVGADPDGGTTFAADTTFYAADDDFGILRFAPPYDTGIVWVDANAIVAETGGSLADFNLNGGIAFHPGVTAP